MMVETEELLVGDEFGNVYYYAVEWNGMRESPGPGSTDATMTLLKRIVVHSQQICGLAWSGDGEQFATGGNDNVACLFDASDVVSKRRDATERGEENVIEGGEKHRWLHGAAVKALAFCPWQKSLVATGMLSWLLRSINDISYNFPQVAAPMTDVSISSTRFQAQLSRPLTCLLKSLPCSGPPTTVKSLQPLDMPTPTILSELQCSAGRSVNKLYRYLGKRT